MPSPAAASPLLSILPSSLLLAALLHAVALPTETAARMHMVPDEYVTIQDAIDHAAPHDTVVVRPGQYDGGLVVTKNQRGIVIASTHGALETILVGRSGGRIITFDEADTLTELTGFTLRGGSPQFDGGAVYAYRSAILITNCEIVGNETLGDGGAIALYESWAMLWRNVMTANVARQGGGIFANASTITIAGNTVSNNKAIQDGGGMLILNCTTTLDSNSIHSNSARGSGGGVMAIGSHGEFRSNQFARNAARRGGGFVCDGGNQPDLSTNRFTDNSPDDLSGCSSGIIQN